MLSSTVLTAMDLKIAQGLIREVWKEGLAVYSLSQEDIHEKHWVSINTHYNTHTALNTERFGIPRNTAVFAFESLLGSHKRWLQQHKNGISEGKAIMNQCWAEIIADTLFEINTLMPAPKKKGFSQGVIKVDDQFFIVKNSTNVMTSAYLLESVQFD